MKQTTLSVSIDDLRVPFNKYATLFIPASFALLFHLAVQYREPNAHHFLVGLVSTLAALTILLHDAWGITHGAAFGAGLSMFGVFTATIFTSMAIYRVFFHPLRNIPGQLSCKLSMWSWPLTDWLGRRQYKIQEMHKNLGDVIRIGPREVSCADPSALMTIYGPTGPAAKAIRGPWYEAQSPQPHIHSLQNEPTMPDHNRRRRDWDPAFSTKALAGYHENIYRNADMLLDQVEKLSKQGPFDLKETLLWFGFDMMGELGFARSFGTLQDGKTSHVVHLVELGVRAINTLGNVPYVAQIMQFLPSPIKAFETWLDAAVDWRISKRGEREYVDADIFAFLLGEEKARTRALNKQELRQDCMLVVVAGSDTTSNALAFTLFELARQPQLVERLRDELEVNFPNGAKPENFDVLRDDAPLLNACLHEALRLWPPVPSGLQRNTTTEMTLPNGKGPSIVVPANTVVSTHTWSMHRDPRNFHKPNSFLPDRWLKEPKGKSEVHNAKAWSPFGFGTTGCIGKNLAYMEMRLVLAQFVMRFDFSMEPADAQDFRNSIRDQFVAAAGEMICSVSPRHVS